MHAVPSSGPWLSPRFAWNYNHHLTPLPTSCSLPHRRAPTQRPHRHVVVCVWPSWSLQRTTPRTRPGTNHLVPRRRSPTCCVSHYARQFAITRWPGRNFRACGIHGLTRSEHLRSTDAASAADQHDHHLIDLVQIALSRQPLRLPLRPISTSNLHHSLFVVFYLHPYVSPSAAWTTAVPRGHELPSAACIGSALSSLPSCGHILAVTWPPEDAMVTTAYGPSLAPYGTTGHHPTIRSTVRLNPFIQPFYNHRPLLRRSTCDIHEVVLGSSTLSTIFLTLTSFTSTPHSSKGHPHGQHLEQRFGQRWRTVMEITATLFFQDTNPLHGGV